MNTRAARMLLGAIVMLGCSDATGPAPGTFQAQLSGAFSLGLSGPSNAGVIYTEELPYTQFAIRMYAGHGDTTRAIAPGRWNDRSRAGIGFVGKPDNQHVDRGRNDRHLHLQRHPCPRLGFRGHRGRIGVVQRGRVSVIACRR